MSVMTGRMRYAPALCCAIIGAAQAANPLPAETQLVAATGAAPPTSSTFTITSTEDLVVTLTDLQVPAELTSAGVVVTQAGAIVGSGQLAAPATNASVSIPAASGAYTMTVFGVPGKSFSAGTFSACVAPKTSPSNCIQGGASFVGNITTPDTAKDPTVSTLSTTLTVTTADTYTFTFTDLTFPVALQTQPSLALFQGSTPIIPTGQTTPAITSGTTLSLTPGTYNLLSIAQADATVQRGLYNITIIGATGATVLPGYSPPSGTTAACTPTTTVPGIATPVGLLSGATPFSNASAQNVTLTVTDYAFPGALAGASALLTSFGTVVGSQAISTGGPQTFPAPAGCYNLQLWTYGSAGSTAAGTYSADVSAGATDLQTVAQGVGPVSNPSTGVTDYAYAFVTPKPLSAAVYTASATDLQFPAALSGFQYAVAQNGKLVQPAGSAAVNFTAVAGNAVVLVSADAPSTTANGLFDVNIQSTGSAAAVVFDKTQSISAVGAVPPLFNSQTVTVADNTNFTVNLTDLKFPVAFDSLALVVSRGSQVLGKVVGNGSTSFDGTPGNYTLTFLGTPSADQLFGLYAASIVDSPPTVKLTASASSVAAGGTVTLSWSAANATSCTASGGWTGTQATNASTATETVSATTTYTLTCTGLGGSASQSVTVTATTAPASSHGGGAIDAAWLIGGAGLLIGRLRRSRAR